MNTADDELERLLRAGHPEIDRYEPVPFDLILEQARREHRSALRRTVSLLSAAAMALTIASVAILAWPRSFEPGDRGGGLATSSASASVSPTLRPTPELTLHPAVSVSPGSSLAEGSVVQVRVTGFGDGAKVWVSECASAAIASDLGCGRQLAAQTLIVTDPSGSGSARFEVSRDAATQPINRKPTATCTTDCVVVATLGQGNMWTLASLAFASPATGSSCAGANLLVQMVHSGGGLGTVGGSLQFTNRGSTPCVLAGYPTVVGVTAAGARTIARHASSPSILDYPPVDGTPLVSIAPGQAAFAAFAGSDIAPTPPASCPPPYHTLDVTAPGTTKSFSVPAYIAWLGQDLPACSGIEVMPLGGAQLVPWLTSPAP